LATKSPREVVLAIGTDRQFTALVDMMGLKDSDEKYRNNPSRIANRDALLSDIEGKLQDQDPTTFVQDCRDARIPASLIKTIPEALQEPQSQGMVVAFPDGVKVIASPLQLSSTPVKYTMGPQPLGKHSKDEILNLWE